MSFFAPEFLLGFPAVYLLYHAVHSPRFRLILLLVSSLALYSLVSGEKAWVLLAVSGAAWLGIRGKAGWVWLLLLFFPLVYYKYVIWWTSGVAAAMAALPAGLSFFSFQSYAWAREQRQSARGEERPSFWQFLLYISFFPQVVAGPIVPPPYFQRITGFLNGQVRAPGLRKGLFLLAAGFACKTLADELAALVDPVFQNPAHASGGQVALAWLAFSLQIYLDFSAYSSLAIGVARLLNFHLPENFYFPYHAGSLQSFWRRWHTTLGIFLRDQVYVRLGGSRQSFARMALAIVGTFLLGGLWHGAGLLFIAWGLLHGLLLLLEQAGRVWLPGKWKKFMKKLGYVYTPLLVAMLWLPFRAGMSGDTNLLFQLVEALSEAEGWRTGVATGDLRLTICALALVLSAPWLYKFLYLQALRRSPVLLCLLAALVVAIAFSLQSRRPFIYFVF